MSIRRVMGVFALLVAAVASASVGQVDGDSGEGLTSLDEILELVRGSFPTRGASAATFRVSHAEDRGQFWFAIHWERNAFAVAQALNFAGRTSDGKIYFSRKNGSSWEFVSEEWLRSGPRPVSMDRSTMGNRIPAYRLLQDIQEAPEVPQVRVDGEGHWILQMRRPTPDGKFQDVSYTVDQKGRVIKAIYGTGTISRPNWYEYDENGSAESGDYVIPVRRVSGEPGDNRMVLVRTSFEFFPDPDPDLFAPETAKKHATRAHQHVSAVPVHPPSEAERRSSHAGGDAAGFRPDDADPIAPRSPGPSVKRRNPVGISLIVLGIILIVVALIVVIRRQ